MKRRRMIEWVVVVAVWATVKERTRAADTPDGQRWWSHVAFLADDKLQGRDTGSEGHRQAAEYVAREFARAGLVPAASDGFFQPVKFTSRRIVESESSLVLLRNGQREPLTLGEDATLSARVDPPAELEADLVFAGYGLSIPEAQHDDYEGLDVRGKLVVYVAGAPARIAGPLAAHMQYLGERAALLKQHGAVGAIMIQNPKHMDIPWERASLARFLPAMSLAEAAMDETQGMKLMVAINPARAEKLFQGSGHTFDQILAAANSEKPLPHFALPARLAVKAKVERASVNSDNVVALLLGHDPVLKNEYVVFTAHLDHVGVGKPIKGDAIYNGAMDNASGVAAQLDVAARLKETGTKLRRSVLFVSVTGEEKGLLGSRFFANHPTVPPGSIVANLNLDMFLPLFPLKKLTIYGLDESDLGTEAAAVAESSGVEPQRDLEPARNIFIRSDQYSFIRRGVPALAFKVGYDKGSPQEQVVKKWLRERYHAPSDDLAQPVDKAAAGAFDILIAKLLERIANRDLRPRWKETSFFKRFAN
jgi:Zn-dependent M28 family amino/carboxypeptidase